MSYHTHFQARLVIAGELTPEEQEKLLDTIHDNVQHAEVGDTTDSIIKLEVDTQVNSAFLHHEFLNDIHKVSPNIKSVTAIEVGNIFHGEFFAHASDQTTDEQASAVQSLIVQDIVDNFQEFLNKIDSKTTVDIPVPPVPPSLRVCTNLY